MGVRPPTKFGPDSGCNFFCTLKEDETSLLHLTTMVRDDLNSGLSSQQNGHHVELAKLFLTTLPLTPGSWTSSVGPGDGSWKDVSPGWAPEIAF